MTAVIKTGRTDECPSSFNLFFSNGLRLSTPSLLFLTGEEKAETRRRFLELVEVMRARGFEIEGNL